MSHRRGEMQLFTMAIAQGWPVPEEVKTEAIQTMIDIVAGRIKSSPREKIRAAECLAKMDALNVAREGQEKTRKLDVQVLPPAYEQMTNGANNEMIDYLRTVAITDEGRDSP